MLKNYFKTTLRHLWHQKLFTGLNVLGLAVSISACWIIYRILDHEFSYDARLPNKERIYKVISTFNREGTESRMGGVSAPLYQGIEDELTGVERVVPVYRQWVSRVEVHRDNEVPFAKEDLEDVVATKPSYFTMLPYTWLAGNRRNALSSPENVVLSESRAKVYFPDLTPEKMLQRTITYYGRDTVTRTVTGIVADYDTPSEFTAQEFLMLPKADYASNAWTNTNGTDKLYLQLGSGVNAGAKIRQINELDARHWSAFEKEWKSKGNAKVPDRSRSYELLPITDVHFSTDVSDYGTSKTSKAVLYGLVGIGVFLLILACINYINMSLAQIPQRAKEIGVRKTLGGRRWQLIRQSMGETLFTAALAAMMAFALSRLGFWFLSDMIPQGVSPASSFVVFMAFMSILLGLVTLIAGLYPGWVATKVRTVDIFRNHLTAVGAKNRFSLQKLLIIFQFTVALVFIIGTIIVSAQLRYTLKADMGFNKDAIVLASIPWKLQFGGEERYKDKQFTLFNEIKKLPGVAHVAMGTEPLSSGYSSSPFGYAADGKEPVEIIAFKKFMDTAYLRLYKMDLLAGHNIHVSDTVSEFIINETAAKAFGFTSPAAAIGQFIGQRGNGIHAIVGVVKDFHTQDFYTPIKPLVMAMEKENLSTFNIRLDSHNPGRWQATLKAIGEKWALFYPSDTYHVKFYDETLEALYTQERQLGKLVNLATAISILISCLGLFGLATLTTFQRSKEIGIRKVLGATVAGIVAMLSKDFVRLVIIALVIAAPIAWWAMNKWLEDFAYKIEIQWWMFAVAGVGALAIALFTVSFQAIRAAIANPVDSLRDE